MVHRITRRFARAATVAAVVTASAVATAGAAGTAQATTATFKGSIGNCTLIKGAMVGVTFAHWSGPNVRGCDTTPTTGLELLQTAGFKLAGTQNYGLGFICRIGHSAFNTGTLYPTPAQDPCIYTPPATAYWSYWVAAKGVNTWTYSGSGASSHTASNGEAESWAFGGGTQPSFTPNDVRNGLPTS